MALDEHRFVSPRMLEIVYPFLLIHYLLDWFEGIDKKYGTKFIDGVDNFFKTVCGEEILARCVLQPVLPSPCALSPPIFS